MRTWPDLVMRSARGIEVEPELAFGQALVDHPVQIGAGRLVERSRQPYGNRGRRLVDPHLERHVVPPGPVGFPNEGEAQAVMRFVATACQLLVGRNHVCWSLSE